MDISFKKLDVYKVALEFVSLSAVALKKLPRGQSHLNDQLKRAASSIVLNIAEGAGEFEGSRTKLLQRVLGVLGSRTKLLQIKKVVL